MFSLTPRIDRIMQGIKAGKQKTGKLVATLLGNPQEPADRRERFRVAFPWLRASTGIVHIPCRNRGWEQSGNCSSLRQRSVGNSKAQMSPGKADPQFMLLYRFVDTRKFNSCSYLHSWISGIEDLCLQRHCTKFSHARHSYKLY